MIDRKIVILGNKQEWCKYSLSDFAKYDARLINSIFPGKKTVFHKLIRLHYSEKMNRIVNLPLKRIWYKIFCDDILPNTERPLLLIIYDWNKLGNDEGFLSYVKHRYKDVKMVYMFTNIAKISGAMKNSFIGKLKEFYDVIYAFDEEDSRRYGFRYSPLLYSLNHVNKEPPINQVFYVGNAKDRLPTLFAVYDRLRELGETCNFHIVGVPEEQVTDKEGIIFNQPISYEECIYNIEKSTCLLDVIQGESTGFTIKVCEAIYYNKLLITTNEHIRDLPFYSERYIKIIKNPNEITSDFFENAALVQYDKSGTEYFSVDRFMNQLEYDLKHVK